MSKSGKIAFEPERVTAKYESPSGITNKIEAFKSLDLKAFCFPRFDAEIADS